MNDLKKQINTYQKNIKNLNKQIFYTKNELEKTKLLANDEFCIKYAKCEDCMLVKVSKKRLNPYCQYFYTLYIIKNCYNEIEINKIKIINCRKHLLFLKYIKKSNVKYLELAFLDYGEFIKN